MTTQRDVTTPPPDQQLSRTTRVTLAALGCLALAFAGTGAAYAGSLDTVVAGDPEDPAWVTVVEDGGASGTGDCPANPARETSGNGSGA